MSQAQMSQKSLNWRGWMLSRLVNVWSGRTVFIKNAPSASMDGRNMFLPLNSEWDDLRYFGQHESSHFRFTDHPAWVATQKELLKRFPDIPPQTVHGVLNILTDCKDEKLFSRVFPGAGAEFKRKKAHRCIEWEKDPFSKGDLLTQLYRGVFSYAKKTETELIGDDAANTLETFPTPETVAILSQRFLHKYHKQLRVRPPDKRFQEPSPQGSKRGKVSNEKKIEKMMEEEDKRQEEEDKKQDKQNKQGDKKQEDKKDKNKGKSKSGKGEKEEPEDQEDQEESEESDESEESGESEESENKEDKAKNEDGLEKEDGKDDKGDQGSGKGDKDEKEEEEESGDGDNSDSESESGGAEGKSDSEEESGDDSETEEGEGSDGSGSGDQRSDPSEEFTDEQLEQLEKTMEKTTEYMEEIKEEVEEKSKEKEENREVKSLLYKGKDDLDKNKLHTPWIARTLEEIIRANADATTVMHFKFQGTYDEVYAHVLSTKRREIEELAARLRDVRGTMVKQMGKSGKFSMSRSVSSYAGGKTPLFERKRPQVGLDVGILVDQSGSMSGSKIDIAREVSIIMAEALRTVPNLIFQISGFSDYDPETHYERQRFPPIANKIQHLYRHIVYKDFNDTRPLALGTMNSLYNNKDGFHVRMCGDDLERRGRPGVKKLLVVISDGAPSDYQSGTIGAEDTKAAVNELRQKGINVIAVACNISGYYKAQFEGMYGDNVIFADMSNLLKVMTHIAETMAKMASTL